MIPKAKEQKCIISLVLANPIFYLIIIKVGLGTWYISLIHNRIERLITFSAITFSQSNRKKQILSSLSFLLNFFTQHFWIIHQDFFNLERILLLIYNLQVLLNCCWRKSEQNGGGIELLQKKAASSITVTKSRWYICLRAARTSPYASWIHILHLFRHWSSASRRFRYCTQEGERFDYHLLSNWVRDCVEHLL